MTQRAAERRSPHRAICEWICSHPGFARYRTSRQARRRLAMAFLAVVTAFPIVGWLTDEVGFVLLLLVPYAAGAVLLAAATFGLLERPQRSLDERELALRRNVFAEPYLVGAVMGLAGGLVVAAALSADDGLMMGWMLFVSALLFGLPTLVLAWRLPDEVPGDA